MKIVIKIVISTAVLLAFSSFAAETKTSNKVELMYVQHADSGKISKLNKQEGCYTVTLTRLAPTVIYFSNYPHHQSGRMNLKKFETSWQHAENGDHIQPNAVIHAHNNTTLSERSAFSASVILSNMKYNADKNSMTYTICALNANEKIALSTGSKASRLHQVDLFIDPFDPWPP